MFPAHEPEEHPTPNIERPTSNHGRRQGHWRFDVGCWALDVGGRGFKGSKREMPHSANSLPFGRGKGGGQGRPHPIPTSWRLPFAPILHPESSFSAYLWLAGGSQRLAGGLPVAAGGLPVAYRWLGGGLAVAWRWLPCQQLQGVPLLDSPSCPPPPGTGFPSGLCAFQPALLRPP